jgi:hypothetical protein
MSRREFVFSKLGAGFELLVAVLDFQQAWN